MNKISNNYFRVILICCLIFIGTGCNQNKTRQTTLPPDLGQRLVTQQAMVSSARPSASKIGAGIMKKGGNAVDAAVATAFAVSVEEPEMSGLGGGGCMVVWLNEKKEAVFIDFYASKRAQTYKDITKKDKKGLDLLSVAIPGYVAGLLYAQKKYGNLTRQEVMQPAIELAKKGFPMYKSLARYIKEDATKLERYRGASLYLPDGEPYPIGKIFKQITLAKTLELIAENGSSAFYDGALTDDMIEVMNEGGNPVTRVDFRDYKVRINKKPLTSTYKKWIVLSAPPPQTGMEIIEGLNLLEPFNMKKIGLPTRSDSAFKILTTVLRAGRADDDYIEDSRWKNVPAQILTSKQYAKQRASSIFQFPVPHSMDPGDLSKFKSSVHSNSYREKTINDHNTTSISVVDPEGNAVALTQTNSSLFGSGAWVNGFFLNNSGYNFAGTQPDSSFETQSEYRTRRSTIAPTIILSPDSTVKLVIGAPGGGRIPTAIVSNIVYNLDYDMDPRAAVRMPRIYPFVNSPIVQIETGFSGSVLNSARKIGYKFSTSYPSKARIYVIKKSNGYWIGAADPRHEGGVAGY